MVDSSLSGMATEQEDYAHTVSVHITDEGKIELISGEVSDGMISFDAASQEYTMTFWRMTERLSGRG